MTEDSLFERALHLPATERASFLDRHCAGNMELRQRLETLLAAHAAPHASLDPPTIGERTVAHPAGSAGTVIAGRYRLVEQIGEGGMGAVWLAEQTEPVRRRVAVKLIHSERASSRTILARFEAERQAIALMDHPHIARLFDAGTTESGAPFFVMELVKGVPLTDYCDANRLAVPERLRLFVQICSAVQHAHQKGIIHRDLKPSNILVERHDGTAVPKVIDFGLAKATSGLQLSEHTLFTGLGTVMGTPLYMAPEQATFNALDIDTRADVYALGVILYELLTGTTPITRDTVKKAALDEMMRVIREEEAPTPSSRLSSSESRGSVAANRQTEPVKLGRFVKGDLDWIVMKALAKERDRRYETANGFSQDIDRFLNHEPVTAGPPGAAYRIRKFVRRNRGQVIAAGLVIAALVVGMSGTTYGFIRADDQRRVAEAKQKEAEDERAKAAAAALAEAEARKRAEQAQQETMADFRASTDEAIEHLIGSKPELGPHEKAYLENTLKRLLAFAARQPDDERGRVIRGEGYSRVGFIWQNLGQTSEAQKAYREAIAIQRGLVDQFPGVAAYRQDLANSHNVVGNMLASVNRRREAMTEYFTARDIQKELVERFPDDPEYKHELALSHGNLAIQYRGEGQPEEARKAYMAARKLLKEIVELPGALPDYRHDLARNHLNFGYLLSTLKNPADAQPECVAAREMLKKLVDEFPKKPEYRQDLAKSRVNLGLLLANLSKLEDARIEYLAARDIQKDLTERYPAVPGYRADLALLRNNLATLYKLLGDRPNALAECSASVALWKELVDESPDMPKFAIELAGSSYNYGNLITEDGRPADSLEWYDLGIRVLKPICDKDAHESITAGVLGPLYWNRAFTFHTLRKPAEAIKDWDRAIEYCPPADRRNLRASRVLSQMSAGLVAEAIAEVAALTGPAAGGAPVWSADWWYKFARIYAGASTKIADKKQEYADRAMDMLHNAVKAGYKDAGKMAKDEGLAPLRGRADFTRLLSELEKK